MDHVRQRFVQEENRPVAVLEWLGKTVASRIITALLVLGTAGAGYWFWQHPEHLALTWNTIKYTLAWMAFAAALPWATFFLTPWVIRKESNAASALLLAGYLAADVALALYLAGGVRDHNALTWVVLGFGFLVAMVYNYAVCEFVSDRIERL